MRHCDCLGRVQYQVGYVPHIASQSGLVNDSDIIVYTVYQASRLVHSLPTYAT
jgi:hypothetical protein